MKYNLPFFGELNLTDLEEYYETQIQVDGRTIQVDLNFENSTIELEKMVLIEEHLNCLEKLNRDNKYEIGNDYQNRKNSYSYISDLLEQLDDENFEEIFNGIDKSKSKNEQMLQGLFLKRIGFYPEVENAGIVSDYTISEEFTDDLLVVFRKLNFTFDGISVES